MKAPRSTLVTALPSGSAQAVLELAVVFVSRLRKWKGNNIDLQGLFPKVLFASFF